MHGTNIEIIDAQHAKFAFKSIVIAALQIVYIRDAVRRLYQGVVYFKNAKRFHGIRECNFIYDRRNKAAFIEPVVTKVQNIRSMLRRKVKGHHGTGHEGPEGE
jgi:hypothetical protein